MIVCGDVLGFVKALLARGVVVGELRGEEIQRNGSLQAGVLGLVHHADSTFTEPFQDLVVGNRLTDGGTHDSPFRGDEANTAWSGPRIKQANEKGAQRVFSVTLVRRGGWGSHRTLMVATIPAG